MVQEAKIVSDGGPPPEPVSTREAMEQLNAEASGFHVWVRTERNAPAQLPWFKQGAPETLSVASGRVGANQIKAVPHRWSWDEYSPYLEQLSQLSVSGDVSPVTFADRQSILLTNPGLGGRLQVTNTIRCAISIYNPGDIAPAHVHTPNASRTILTEHGGYTNVEGERCAARRGDVVLTPNGTWHDHGNDSDTPVIWIDTLDWPLMEYLDCAWIDQEYRDADGKPATSQAVTRHDGYSGNLYGGGGLRPSFVNHQRGFGKDVTPLFHYRGEDILATLRRLRSEGGDPYEGTKVELVNPVSGRSVFPTLTYSAQLLHAGERTRPKRETSSGYMVVIGGSGTTVIGGREFDWSPNDVVAMPNFCWREHVNTSHEDAIVYTVTDKALMTNIGQYRAQGREQDGSVVELGDEV